MSGGFATQLWLSKFTGRRSKTSLPSRDFCIWWTTSLPPLVKGSGFWSIPSIPPPPNSYHWHFILKSHQSSCFAKRKKKRKSIFLNLITFQNTESDNFYWNLVTFKERNQTPLFDPSILPLIRPHVSALAYSCKHRWNSLSLQKKNKQIWSIKVAMEVGVAWLATARLLPAWSRPAPTCRG